MRHIKGLLPLVLCGCLIFSGCGKNLHDTASDERTESAAAATTAVQTASTTEAAATDEPAERPSSGMDGSLSAYLWQAYDIAFAYPAAYTVAPEDAGTEGAEIMAANTGDTADGVLKMVVFDGCYTTDKFAQLERMDVLNMMGLKGELLVESHLEDITLPNLSGVDAAAKKLTTQCEYDGHPAQMAIVLANCFDTDHFYALEFVSTDEDYNDFCDALEQHLYIGNCQVNGDKVRQLPDRDSEDRLEIRLGGGCVVQLSPDWREETLDGDADDSDSDEADDDLSYITAAGDYLLLSMEDGLSEEDFETLMDTQTVGSGAGGLTITAKEKNTVHGATAYLIHQTRPSWGLSDAEYVPVYNWYINADCGLIMISMIDVSGKYTDFFLHPENFVTF